MTQRNVFMKSNAMINNTAGSWDDKMSKIVAVSGATKEEASRALDENGGDIDGAVSPRKVLWQTLVPMF